MVTTPGWLASATPSVTTEVSLFIATNPTLAQLTVANKTTVPITYSYSHTSGGAASEWNVYEADLMNGIVPDVYSIFMAAGDEIRIKSGDANFVMFTLDGAENI